MRGSEEHEELLHVAEEPEATTKPMSGSGQDPPKRVPVIAEALGYVGGALALAGVIALVVRFWPLLGIFGHVGIGVALAVAGLVAGFILHAHESPSIRRLARFLLAVGVVGVGVAVGFAVRDVMYTYFPSSAFFVAARASAADWGWFAGALAAAIAGGVVYWRVRDVLPHLVFGVAVGATSLLVLPLLPVTGAAWGAGAVLVVVSLAWGALSYFGMLPPRVEGLLLAALGVAGGIEMMVLSAEPNLVWAMWIGVVACGLLIAAGSAWREYGVLGVGAIALMVFAGQLIGVYLGFGTGTAIALIVFGLVVLGVAVNFMLRERTDVSRMRSIVTEVVAYLAVGVTMGGAGILLAQSWDMLGTVGRILLPLGGAIAAYAFAIPLKGETGTARRRLSQVLYAIGVLSVGITGAMIAQPLALRVFGTPGPAVPEDPAGDWTLLAGGLAATTAGALTYWLRRGSLTLIAAIIAITIAVMGVANVTGVHEFGGGAVLVVLGTLAVVLGVLHKLLPDVTAIAAGCTVDLFGFQMMTQSNSGSINWGPAALAIAFGVAAIVASIYLKRGTLLGFGAAAIVMFSMTIVLELFGGSIGAPLLMLIAGIIFIAVAAVVAVLAPRMRRNPRGPAPPEIPISPPLAHA